MSDFFRLAIFEYKKILKRKNTWVSIFMILIVLIFLVISSITGADYWHSEGGTPVFEAMKLDKEVVCSKTGIIDEAFIKEAIGQNAVMLADDKNYVINDYGKHLKSSAYIKYILPYKNAVNIINSIYETNPVNLSTNGFQIINMSSIKPIDTLSLNDAKNFYTDINKAASNYISNLTFLSQNEKNTHLEMLSRVETPYRNDHYDGYLHFNMSLQVIALIIFIVIAICISPIFANEYYMKTDQIILSSKYGKSKVIFAKLFTGISFSVGISFVTIFVFLLSMLSVHGFNGADMAIQTIDVYSTYPVNLLQASLIAAAVTVFTALLFGMLSMLLSSLLKSSFLSVIISFLILLLPAIINVSPKDRLLYQILQVFPARAAQFSNIFSNYMFEFFGFIFTPAKFYIVFSIIGTLLLVPLAKNAFKNHQIG